MKNTNGGQKIDSLQALRALAFTGIFLGHAKASVSWAELGVSVFLVMSGFLMIYAYHDRTLPTTVKDSIRFSVKKMKKLYPLHIVTMLCAIPISLAMMILKGLSAGALAGFLRNLLLNVVLLQSWYPDATVNTSLNGVAWYLSVTLFLYIVFPHMAKILKKRKNDIVLVLVPVLAIALQLLLCTVCIDHLGEDSATYIWMMYCFPLFRLGDFVTGCCLGCYFLEKTTFRMSRATGTLAELAAVLATAAALIWLHQEHTLRFARALHNWTSVYILIAVVWVFLFAVKAGWITELLSNRFLIFIGNISAYAFLIHYVITQYTTGVIMVLGVQLSDAMTWIIVCAEFAATVLATMLYQKLELACRKRKGTKE